MADKNGQLAGLSASEALAAIRSGQRIVIGSGAAEPQHLVQALAERASSLSDAELVHLLTLGTAPCSKAAFGGRIRHNALFIGPNVRDAVQKGLADYTPCLLSEIPKLFRSGRLPIDTALVQVAPPRGGLCSLGVSVDILKAAVESAPYVVAQINARMPWTEGDSKIRVEDVDAFVEKEEALPELPHQTMSAAALWIGRHVARLVPDGATLQMGIGRVPDAVLAALEDKRDLGIHSEMVSDGVLGLLRSGALTGKRKTLHPGRIVASFCLGSQAIYEAAGTAAFEFHPSDYVNDPYVIGRNACMVSVNSALQVDLSGQVAADSIGRSLYSGVGGQVDFVRGAARSEGGRSIIALPSTAQGGSVSRIVGFLAEGTGVTTTRAEVDFVVTEYGIASLKGKTLRERAIALIGISHPSFRSGLAAMAKSAGLLDFGHVMPEPCGPYLSELETRAAFAGQEVLFRPLKPSDERRLKELFYGQSAETTLLRFGIPLKSLSERQFQELVAIDYCKSMAVGAFCKEGGRERLIAVGRYYAEPGHRFAEAAFTVTDRWQNKGLGSFLLDYLSWIAKGRGLDGFEAEISAVDARMRRLLDRCYDRVYTRSLGPDGESVSVLFKDWKGRGSKDWAKACVPEPSALP